MAVYCSPSCLWQDAQCLVGTTNYGCHWPESQVQGTAHTKIWGLDGVWLLGNGEALQGAEFLWSWD